MAPSKQSIAERTTGKVNSSNSNNSAELGKTPRHNREESEEDDKKIEELWEEMGFESLQEANDRVKAVERYKSYLQKKYGMLFITNVQYIPFTEQMFLLQDANNRVEAIEGLKSRLENYEE